MRKELVFFLFLLSQVIYAQQDYSPVTGVSDKRPEIYGFKNARVVVDYQTTMDNTDLLVSEGRILSVGKNISFPKGTIVFDLTGKSVYPSFVDVYAGNYGIKTQTPAGETNQFPQMISIQQQAER